MRRAWMTMVLLLSMALVAHEVPSAVQLIRLRLRPPAAGELPCTTTLADAEEGTLQAYITNTASDGDVICLPAGAATWTTAVTINSQSTRTKMVEIRGAGTDPSTGTRITTQVGSPSPALIVWLSSAVSRFKLSQIRWIQGTSSTSDESIWGIALRGHADTQASVFRLHHNVFVQSATAGQRHQNSLIIGGASSSGSPDNGRPYIWGVLDHNTWSGGPSFQTVDVIPRNDVGSGGTDITGCSSDCNRGHLAWRDWTVSDHQGTWRNVFLEDNVWSSTSIQINQAALDGGTGAAVVVRYNTFTNNWMSGHGPDTLGGARGSKWWEFYNNTLITSATTSCGWVMAIGYKSGTGVAYNNTFWDGTHRGTGNPHGIPTSGGCVFNVPSSFFMDYRRSGTVAYGAKPLETVSCGDEVSTTGDNMDNPSDPGKGWICWDMTGARRGADDGARTLGYRFATEPIVTWNNTWSDGTDDATPREIVINANGPPSNAEVAEYLQERREWISDSSCDAPNDTDPGCVAFWDAGTGTKLNYTAYAYPHPLQTNGTP